MLEIYTIGFTQKSAEQFFKLLEKASIQCLIDVRLNNVSQLAISVSGYVLAYTDKRYIPGSKLYDYLKRYPCRPEDLWRMLIGNSIKLFHPLSLRQRRRGLLTFNRK